MQDRVASGDGSEGVTKLKDVNDMLGPKRVRAKPCHRVPLAFDQNVLGLFAAI
jgi:hypothetical protein